MAKTRRVLVVGDAHFTPGQELSRADALGNAVLEERPDDVVLIGDWVSMDSLSSYDKKGGTQLEGRRIKDDVEVGTEALRRFSLPYRRWSTRQARNKKKTWQPRVTYVEGNHEYRIIRWWENDAQLYGTYALPEYYGGFIDQYVVYSDYLWINGVGFTHIPFNKVGPISSNGLTTSIAQKAAIMSARSVVFGHTHLFDVGRVMRVGAKSPIYGVNVGCFFEPEHDPYYMNGRLKDWWRGVVWMIIEPDGQFDLETINLARFKQRYL